MKTTKKINPRVLLASGGIVLLFILFIFGKTVPEKNAPAAAEKPAVAGALSIKDILKDYKGTLKAYQLDYLAKLENGVVRGDVREQQIHTYHQLAKFWKDSVRAFEPYAWYTAEAAKLENSEKSLTFAAHLMESRLVDEGSPALLTWLATNAKVLFEKALELNPANDSSKIGLGACYIFGNISDNPMQGILPIREIAEKNPGNVYAQKILALGGLKTGQYDKAIERLNIVLQKEPGNMEIIFRLAEAYERKGDKAAAIAQYRKLKELIQIPEAKDEIQHRIEELQK